ncbi:hypothetical protein CK203_057563 [Vitis vinifera]|uniref:Uncharacterized protein n=1 Tax=Vitis vinifera TaxID=29760 RepID=A0A438GGW8_VITVI|nr:hypothetical protein CK203_057563 [Vitis vinifera]
MDGMQNDLSQKIDNVQYSISRLTNLNTMQEKGKFPSQPHQNPKGVHEVEAQERESSKVKEVKAIITLRSEKDMGEKKSKEDDHDSSVDEEPRIIIKEDMMKKHMPPHFPQALHGKKGTKNTLENFEVLRQVKVNIPLLDMIKQVLTYAKFLKDLCTVKRGLNVTKKAFLTEQPTSITLSLADRSVKIPRGIIEDVLVQIDKFYYPVDFVVLDTDPVVTGTNYMPIILGRPFLATSNAIINCRNEVMQLTFGNMTLELNIFHLCKKPLHPEEEEGLANYHVSLEEEEEILPLFNEEESHRVGKEEPPKLTLKLLPTGLKYAYLEEDKQCPMVILHLSPIIKRIVYSESLEDVRRPLDSLWVSPTQVVPKKSGIMVVQNDKGEDVSTRLLSLEGECLSVYAMHPQLSKDGMLSIFSDMVERILEVFMDDITVYGSAFEDA